MQKVYGQFQEEGGMFERTDKRRQFNHIYFYFFGRFGIAGGARPVDIPGRDGIDGGGRGPPCPACGRGLLGTIGIGDALAFMRLPFVELWSKERIDANGSKSSNFQEVS